MKQRRSNTNRGLAKKTPTEALSKELIGQFIDAAARNHGSARNMLRAHPQLLNARWLHDETALHFLAVEGFVEGVRFLAECGADVNAVNHFGGAPLIDVARLGNSEIAAIPLEYGANPNAQSATVNNPLDCAVRAKNAALVSMLLDAGADARYVTDIGESIFDALPASGIKRTQIRNPLCQRNCKPCGGV